FHFQAIQRRSFCKSIYGNYPADTMEERPQYDLTLTVVEMERQGAEVSVYG
ncbi:MAG: hypothetical protein GY757_20805, partial [bacterium]|nr:hypothetical protein [bacterium]